MCERQQQRLHKRFVKLCPSFMSVQRGAAAKAFSNVAFSVARRQNIYNRFASLLVF
jgi:hypothetical protein